MEQQVNLYQPILRAEKRLFSASAIVVGVLVLVVSLGGLAGFAAWRTTRIETAVAELEHQEAARLASVQHAAAALGGDATLEQLEAEIVQLAQQVAARERALASVGTGGTATRGFATRLEALSQPAIDGLWLQRIVFDPAHGGVALRGATRDPALVPQYLAALQDDRSLAGAAFGAFELRRATAAEAPAAAIFTVAAPQLAALLHADPSGEER